MDINRLIAVSVFVEKTTNLSGPTPSSFIDNDSAGLLDPEAKNCGAGIGDFLLLLSAFSRGLKNIKGAQSRRRNPMIKAVSGVVKYKKC